MRTVPTSIPEVVRVLPTRHTDERGYFSETFRADWFAPLVFVQDNQSQSRHPGTVRGLHFQIPPRAQDKLVRVTRGQVLDVAVDIRVGSPTYGNHVAVILSEENGEQLLVPKGFAHGFVALAAESEVTYKVTDYYSSDHDQGLLWNDPDLGIEWGPEAESAILSDRDRAHPTLSRLPPYFEA
jgi:dTDP-4-dehydrorhamnose 3,5-epimerase